jgi:hypothetical protein
MEYSKNSAHGETTIVMQENGTIQYEWKFAHDVVDFWSNAQKLSDTPTVFAGDFAELLRIADSEGFCREVGFWGWFKRMLGGWDTWIR